MQSGPIYTQIAQQLQRDIARGRLKPGDRITSEAELAKRFEVTVPTVREALALLKSTGLLASQHGIGTFVLGPPKPVEELPPLERFLRESGRRSEFDFEVSQNMWPAYLRPFVSAPYERSWSIAETKELRGTYFVMYLHGSQSRETYAERLADVALDISNALSLSRPRTPEMDRRRTAKPVGGSQSAWSLVYPLATDLIAEVALPGGSPVPISLLR